MFTNGVSRRLRKRRGALTLRRAAPLLAAAGTSLVLLLAAFAFQDNLARFLVNPRTPFQTVTPPPPPAYGARGAWVLWPDKQSEGSAADIFYVHSTTYYSNRGWNAPINDSAANLALKRTAAPNEAGPFASVGPVYGPRYRQATLYSFFTHKFDGVAARRFAYQDVKSAFAAFLAEADPKKPLILVGYGQGGLHIQRLLQDFFQNDKQLRARLAAAYVIGQATPLGLFTTQLRQTPPCEGPESVRCVISYVDYEARFGDEIQRIRTRSMSWSANGDLVAIRDDPILCINPLIWKASNDYVGAERHLGAASATGIRFGARPPALAQSVGARCVDGVLVVDRPEQDFLRRRALFGAKWRAQNFNLFYYDLAADARRRAKIASARLEEEAMRLDPIEESIELDVSPINKVPH